MWPFDPSAPEPVQQLPFDFVLPPGATELTLESKVIAAVALFLFCCVLPFSHLSKSQAVGDDSNVLTLVVAGASVAVGSGFTATCTTCGLTNEVTVVLSLALTAAVVLVFSWTGVAARSGSYGGYDPNALAAVRARLQQLSAELAAQSGGLGADRRRLEAHERAVSDLHRVLG